LLRPSLVAADVNWVSIAGIDGPVRVEVKIRNRHAAASDTLRPAGGGRVEAVFDHPQRAVTPGQRCSIRANWYWAAAGSNRIPTSGI
jgi:tRNA-specific 2-thiouridylase